MGDGPAIAAAAAAAAMEEEDDGVGWWGSNRSLLVGGGGGDSDSHGGVFCFFLDFSVGLIAPIFVLVLVLAIGVMLVEGSTDVPAVFVVFAFVVVIFTFFVIFTV